MATGAPVERASGGLTAVQKILARASGLDRVEPGDVVHPRPELVIIHDGFVETAHQQLSALGYRRIRDPERVVFVTDHEVAYTTQRAVERGRNNRRIAQEWNVGHMYDVGRGGHGHLFPMETGLVRPGMFLFAYDMHCTNFGAVGALAMGAGTEITAVLATGTLWTIVPRTVCVTLEGALPPGSHPRDVGFLLAHGFAQRTWDVDHDYRVIEFAGQASRRSIWRRAWRCATRSPSSGSQTCCSRRRRRGSTSRQRAISSATKTQTTRRELRWTSRQ